MDDLASVTAPEEISRILKVAGATTTTEIYCEYRMPDGQLLLVDLEIRNIIGTNMVLGLKRKPKEPGRMLASVFGDKLIVGAPIEIAFSLVDGQYAVRDIVQDVSLSTFTVSGSRNLLRMQRRKDFRVSVRTDGLRFEYESQPGISHEFPLLDLSAGGVRLLWKPFAGAMPALNSILKGRLFLTPKPREGEKPGAVPPPEKSVEVEAKFVKDHGPDAPLKPELGHALSFQFQNLSQEDSRAILFTCLLIHRTSYGSP